MTDGRATSQRRARKQRSAWGRLWRFLAYVAGLVLFLGITAVVTLSVALNRPKVKAAVEGWIQRSTGVEAEYDRLGVQVVPPAIVAKGLRAADGVGAWGVSVKGVQVRLNVFKKEIGEVVVQGAKGWTRAKKPEEQGEGVGAETAEKPAGTAQSTRTGAGGAGEGGQGATAPGTGEGEEPAMTWGKGFVLRKLSLEGCGFEWQDADGKRLGAVEAVHGEFAELGADRPIKGSVAVPMPGGGEASVTVSAGAPAEFGQDWTRWPVELQVSFQAENLARAAETWGGAAAKDAVGHLGGGGALWKGWASVVGTVHHGFSVVVGGVGEEKGKAPFWKVDVKGEMMVSDALEPSFAGTIEIPEAQWDGRVVKGMKTMVRADASGAKADGVSASLCGGTLRAKEIRADWAGGAVEIALDGAQGAGLELGELLQWAVPAGQEDSFVAKMDLQGRVYFGGEAMVSLPKGGAGGDALQSLKGHFQSKVQGLTSSVGDEGGLGRVLDALEKTSGVLLKSVLPGLEKAAQDWRKALEKNGGRVVYEVAEAEATARGDGLVEVHQVKLGAGGYWLEAKGQLNLADQSMALSGAWAATKDKALALVGGDADALALLPGGEDGSVRIPLAVEGPFASPVVKPDIAAIVAHVKESNAVQEKVQNEVERGLGHLHSKDRQNIEAGLSILQGLLGK